ncbi:MAG: M23 family metallopeptidase [Sphingobacteriales bacterium]|nr:MAG: M23 family metallopeptidase [Sphingobacteriales bacterium]
MNKITRNIIFIMLSAFIFSACNSSSRGIFAKKTAREKYENRIEKIESPEVHSWKKQGEKVLQNPLIVPAPYAENGIFIGDSTDANAFLFTVVPGQKINVSVKPVAGNNFTAFLELWDAENSSSPKLLHAADTLVNSIEHTASGGGKFIVRLQPKLASSGRYDLKIVVNPILGFPISSTVKSNIGSLWGDPRDAGARKHEGIDIFAKKGSPVVAVTHGVVSRIGDGGIGGKVIWFNPDGENFSVYYAHLDTQYVSSGQRMQKGQIMGTVGNTGNAKFTAAHLHFGVYTRNGAVNPLAFVQAVKEPTIVSNKKLNEWYKTNSKTKIYPSPEKKNALVLATAAKIKTVSVSKDFYKVVMENGNKGFVALSDLNDKMKL